MVQFGQVCGKSPHQPEMGCVEGTRCERPWTDEAMQIANLDEDSSADSGSRGRRGDWGSGARGISVREGGPTFMVHSWAV